MARTGRPSKLTDVIDTRPVLDPTTKQPTGQRHDVTRVEQIVGDIRIGLTAHRAAKRAGIVRETLDAWEREAHELRARIANTPDDSTIPLTDKQSTILDFSDAIHRAELEYQAQSEMLLQQAAQGGHEVVERYETFDETGALVSRREVVKVQAPDPKVVQWRLSRRFPAEYVERVQIEGTGEGGAIPLEVRAVEVGEALAQFVAARDAQQQGADDTGTQQTST